MRLVIFSALHRANEAYFDVSLRTFFFVILRDVPVSMILNMIASFPIFLFDFERRFERFRS